MWLPGRVTAGRARGGDLCSRVGDGCGADQGGVAGAGTSLDTGGSRVKRDKKACPDCAEIVRAAARKCKHCGFEFLPAPVPAFPSEIAARPANLAPAPSEPF